MIKNLEISFLFLIFSFNVLFGQIKISPLPISKDIKSDSDFLQINASGKIIPLNSSWYVYSDDNSEKKIQTTVPCVFEGTNTLTFETNLNFTQDEVDNNVIKILFLSIHNTIEISLNNNNIFKKTGSELISKIELPKDLIKVDSPNLISLKVTSKLDSDNTIPVKQRFLAPKYPSGIVREIFLELLPKTHISDCSINYSLNENLSNAIAKINLLIKNPNNLPKPTKPKEQYSINIKLTPVNFNGSPTTFNQTINLPDSDELRETLQITIPNPVLWSPQTPNLYKVDISLMFGQQIIDQISKDLAIFRIDLSNNKLTLNNKPFSLNGTSLIINESELKHTTVYHKLRTDLELIKNTGFNAVRFPKSFPHPYAVKLCQNLGLIALIELPINSIPEEILLKEYFRLISANRFKEIVNQYSYFSNTIFYGLGSSYLSNSIATKDFIENLTKLTTDNNVITYASFVGVQKPDIEGLNLYGIEIYSNSINNISNILTDNIEKDNLNKYFFSEIFYPNYVGSSSGYLVKNSSEAQAKYFEDIIDIARKNKLGGFFFGSLYDFRGDYASSYAGYSESNLYNVGILREKPNLNSITYKLISAKLQNKGKVTIPIGGTKEENKLIFILLALALSIFMALLINIKKKFREDCTRALFRSYNFFADIRDLRILSGFHTIILMLIEIGSVSLLFTILIYYLKTNLLVEKLILSFGNEEFLSKFSYLAWNPEICFISLFIVFLIKVFLISGIVKVTSYFVKIRVRFSNILYTIVWAFLPFTILLPVELILYKVLSITSFNIYIIIFLAILFIWILQRIFKGIHVVFDVRRAAVYLYGLILILIVSGAFVLYYQLTNSTIYYIGNTIQQYKLMSF